MVRQLGKFDLRPCPLRLRSSLLVLGCSWTDAKHRVLLFFHGDESLEHVHRDHGACQAPHTVSWRPHFCTCLANLAETKVVLPLGLWASLRTPTGTTVLETDIFASSTCHCNIITFVHVKILIVGNSERCTELAGYDAWKA